MPPISKPLMAAAARMVGSTGSCPESVKKIEMSAPAFNAEKHQSRRHKARRLPNSAVDQLNFGRGKMGLEPPNSLGQTTSMSVRLACSKTAFPPWF